MTKGQRSTRVGSTAASRAGLLLLIAASLLLAFQSARMGLGGLIVELAQLETDRWGADPRAQSMARADRVAGYYADSIAVVPGNPWALEGLGVLDLQRVRLSMVPDEARAFAADARLRFREGLRQRPTSPFLWANLALAKVYLDEFDGEFLAALRNADELGPWEPGTQQVVLFVGLAAWDKLDAGQRRALSLVVERGGRRNALKIFEIVKNYRRFDLICGLKDYDVLAGPDCRKAAERSQIVPPQPRGKR